MDRWTLVGFCVGFLFGFGGIATVFSMLEKAVDEVQSRISQASTLILFVVILVLIWKVKVLASILVGAVIGAFVNYLLKANGIDLMKIVLSFI